MDSNTEISRVAIVGTGLIGGSWAVCFLAHGLDVVATDPAPDAAVCMGPGLRWALMGPNLINHLGGGPGGIRHFFEQFAGPITEFWANLGSPDLGPELQKKIADGVLEEVDGRSFEALSKERDTLIIGLLQLLSHRAKAEPVAACGHKLCQQP